jgi:hypothetical protein
MYSINGRIQNKETNIGIPDLLVVLLDIDKFQDPENSQSPNVERINLAATTGFDINAVVSAANRLGSVITDRDGNFSFEIDATDFNTGNEQEQKPDIALVALTPEEPGLKLSDRLLYFSNDLRINAGHKEAYIIKLKSELLKQRQVPVPQSGTVENKISNYQKKVQEDKDYNDVVKKVEREKIVVKQAAIQSHIENLQRVIVPPAIAVSSDFSTFIDRDEKVAEKIDAHHTKELDKVKILIDRHLTRNKGIEVTLLLTQSERDSLGIDGSTESKIFTGTQNQETIKVLLGKMNAAGTDNLILTSNNPILNKCLQQSDDTQCATDDLGITNKENESDPDNRIAIAFAELPEPAQDYISGNHGGEANVIAVLKLRDERDRVTFEVRLLENVVLFFDSDGINTNDDTPLTEAEIANYVKKVITNRRAIANTNDKPNQDSVNSNINKFSLKKGPAELASFYDFRVLNIAFGHIWQQIIDDTPVRLAAEATDNAVRNGFVATTEYTSKDQVLRELHYASKISSNPPQNVISNFDITYEEWNALEPEARDKLSEICVAIDYANRGQIFQEREKLETKGNTNDHRGSGYVNVFTHVAERYIEKLKEQGELLIDYVRCSNVRSLHTILADLDKALKSNYAFNIFGADETAKAINFGLLNTYRQKWEPVAYQVGDLVKSIPLSPKEERKYSLKTTFTRKRSEKEAKKNNTSLVQEQNTTSRSEEEIVAKAQTKTTFNLSAEGDYTKWKVSSSLGLEANKESSQNKKDFRESVLKATQEFKEERSVEIDTEENYSSEYNESGTIVNPNDELAVTYLFYELQKRFKVSEQLYRVMPVVMVAQPVPAPNEITEAWVIANDWILSRSLLDDSFRPALQYIAQKNVGDDYAIRELRKNLRTQRQLIETLKRELASLNAEADNRYAALESAISKRLNEEHDANSDGIFTDIGEWFFASGKEDPETAKAREMAARDAQGYAAEKAQKMALNLQREVNALQSITAEYTKAMREHLDKKTMIERLLLHFKSNIIYYMQAIWSMEPSDQRYMRLLNVKVPQFDIVEMDCEIQQEPKKDLFELFRNKETQEKLHTAWLKPKIKQKGDKSLVEIADLDTILGFKGNYMVFPMKQHNAITEIMAMPYIDASFGAMDPDQLSNVSLEDFARYVCCLKEELSKSKFEEIEGTLKEWLKLLLADPLRNGDEIIVPTNSLYIEMMVSANSLLEDFKLKHRELDVDKVREEVQMQALENLRLAKRILTDKLEDPKIDKKIVVEGNVGTHIDVDN